jgi:hypothetical protein
MIYEIPDEVVAAGEALGLIPIEQEIDNVCNTRLDRYHRHRVESIAKLATDEELLKVEADIKKRVDEAAPVEPTPDELEEAAPADELVEEPKP